MISLCGLLTGLQQLNKCFEPQKYWNKYRVFKSIYSEVLFFKIVTTTKKNQALPS